MYQKTILVTGGAGFIGANFLGYFLKKYPQYRVVTLDKLTYAGDISNLKSVLDMENHLFVEGDICDRILVKSLFEKYDVKGVIHFAAESHVDNSIKSPEKFLVTNVNGTYTLLDVARAYWQEKPFIHKSGYEEARFHHISTDEVFGALTDDGFFTEATAYAPNSPYSASKASSDMFVRAYKHTFGMNVSITNCSNNYGYMQHDEKLIPVIIRNAIQGKQIPIYGNGKNVRDWLFVLDHCRAVDLVFHEGKIGETYVIGGNSERKNIEIASLICEILDEKCPREDGASYKEQISFVEDRSGHDYRYAIDATKIKRELGWEPLESFESGILKTIAWYIAKYNSLLSKEK